MHCVKITEKNHTLPTANKKTEILHFNNYNNTNYFLAYTK